MIASKRFISFAIIFSLLAISATCDNFSRGKRLVAKTGNEVRYDRDRYEITNRDVRVSILGLYAPEISGWGWRLRNKVLFNVQVTNLGAEPVVLDPKHFILTIKGEEHKANLNERQESNEPVALHSFPTSVFPQQTTAGWIEFRQVTIPDTRSDFLLRFKVLRAQAEGDIPFEIAWRARE